MNPADLYTLLEKGGMLAVACLAIYAWLMERKENKKLTQQVIDLATAQVASQTENKALLQSMKDVIQQFLNRNP